MTASSVPTINGAVVVPIDDEDDGDVTIVKTSPAGQLPLLHQHHGMVHFGPDGAYVHSGKPLDLGSFFFGLMMGMLALWLIQVWRRGRRRTRDRLAAIGPQPVSVDHDRMAAEVAALARRTATLETIVTDPAQRTAREIDALR